MTLIESIREAGFNPPTSIIWDGAIHRFPTGTSSSKPKGEDGWYIAYDDARGCAAAYGTMRDAVKFTWSDGEGRTITRVELAAIEAEKKAVRERRDAERKAAATLARGIYEHALPVSNHPYLARKKIDCPDGVKAVDEGARLVIPVRSMAGAIASLQYIDAAGNKLFLKNGAIAGGFHSLGLITGAETIVIAEGLSTAQSIRQATGETVVVAFNAGNLPRVAAAIRKLNATAELVIACDDDPAGRSHGELAAKRCSGRTVLPGGGCNDFNDLSDPASIVASLHLAGSDEWKRDLLVDAKADGTETIACRTHNFITILRNAYKGRIRYNEFADEIEVDGESVMDVAAVRMKADLEVNWLNTRFSTNEVKEALGVVAFEHQYHPVREYLAGLQWDGVERVPSFFSDYCGCERSEYTAAVSSSFFISAVARILKPGCKVDTMVILESAEGLGKTRLWKALFGEWTAEVIANMNSKDFFSGMRGVWGADFGELEQLSKADTARARLVITMTHDKYRPHYGHSDQKFPRQCVFVGGTNLEDWQKDPYSARRFLPLRVGESIDVEAAASVRDQLWAEAVVRFDRGEAWWRIPGAKEEQDDRYSGDPWESPVLDHLMGHMETSTAECLSFIEPDKGKHTRAGQMRMGHILRREGWKRIKTTHGWRYFRQLR